MGKRVTFSKVHRGVRDIRDSPDQLVLLGQKVMRVLTAWVGHLGRLGFLDQLVFLVLVHPVRAALQEYRVKREIKAEVAFCGIFYPIEKNSSSMRLLRNPKKPEMEKMSKNKKMQKIETNKSQKGLLSLKPHQFLASRSEKNLKSWDFFILDWDLAF